MRRSKQLLIGIVSLFGLFFLFSNFGNYQVKAASISLQINEVYYDASAGKGGDSIGEWIELYNAGGSPIDIKDWRITDNHSSRVLSAGSLVIPGRSFVLVYKDDGVLPLWEIDTSNLPADLILCKMSWFSGGLSNSGDLVSLVDSTGLIVDAVSWGSDKTVFDLPDVAEGHSLERVTLGVDTDRSTDFDDRIVPTPGKEYLRPIFSTEVAISEVVPAPSSGTGAEFIEITNCGPSPADLSGWQIDDGEGGSKPFRIKSVTISPGDYLVFYNRESKIALNDSGDTVRLIDPDGDIKSQIQYGESERGKSYSQFNQQWWWSSTLTPGTNNFLTAEIVLAGTLDTKSGESVVDIQSARRQTDGQNAGVSGMVTAPPGTLSSRYFYIEDKTAGIQIYNYYKEFPDLRAGDEVAVFGELSGENGDRRIKTAKTSIKKLSEDNPIEPKNVAVSDISELLEGQYVVTRGKVLSTSGDTFAIEDDGKVTVIIRDLTGINKPAMRKGDIVEIAGIVSEYREAYRILPFRQEDVKILGSNITKQHLPRAGPNQPTSAFIALIIILLWKSLPKMKQKLLL